ncbi:MAG: hypothetical protein RSF33_08095 [Hydrogenoanaerobacterium sp.]
MAVNITALEPVEALRDYLGVGAECDELIKSARASALEQLRRATGVNWEAENENAVAAEAVRCLVWLSFYGIRDDSKNTEFLRKHAIQLLSQLQYSAEVKRNGTL